MNSWNMSVMMNSNTKFYQKPTKIKRFLEVKKKNQNSQSFVQLNGQKTSDSYHIEAKKSNKTRKKERKKRRFRKQTERVPLQWVHLKHAL